MHRRKQFLVYPVDYHPSNKPYRKYKIVYSKYQAMKAARRMGDGSEVDESVHIHMKPRCTWATSISGREWIYSTKLTTEALEHMRGNEYDSE